MKNYAIISCPNNSLFWRKLFERLVNKQLLLLLAFLFLGSFNAMAQTPCEGAFRWEDGAAWNGDGTIDDSPSQSFQPKGIVKCGSAAETQSGIVPLLGSVYDSAEFEIDVEGDACIDPSSGLQVSASNPTDGQPIIWLNFDVRPEAGSFQIQINDNSGDTIAWALYLSEVHETGTHQGDNGQNLSGDCGDLKKVACGVESSSTWNTIPINGADFLLASNFYLAVWDQDADGDVEINNFKARFGCGDADFLTCSLFNGVPEEICNDDGTFTINVPIEGINGEYVGYDANSNNENGLSNFVCLTNSGDTNITSGVISLTYDVGTSYAIEIFETNSSSPPTSIDVSESCSHPDPYPGDPNNGNSDSCVVIIRDDAPDCCVEPNLEVTSGSVCAEGQSSVDLENLVTTDQGAVVSFHETLEDAQNNTNALTDTEVSPFEGTSFFVRSQVSEDCYTIQELVISINPLPDVNAGLDKVLTCSVLEVTLDGSSSTPNVSYEWSGPDGFMSTEAAPTVSLFLNAPGTYSLTVTDENGCTATDIVEVVLGNSTPDVNAGPDKLLTCEVFEGNLEGSSNTPNVSYEWSGPDGFSSSEQNPSISIFNAPGIYTLTVTGENGCTASDTVEIALDTTQPQVSCPENIVLCSGGNPFELSGGTPENGTYSGNGVVEGVFDPSEVTPGIYEITYSFTETNGCSDFCIFFIEVIQVPEPETACYETATFNTDSCEWDVTGDMPTEPATACYETATFNTDSCQWDVTGDMPTEPATACYETATFNTDSCEWDVSGDMPTEPATACYETATFNTDSCEWDVTGDMPTEPATACYETATFNTDSCEWDVSGDMPTEPETACYETATFNTDSCQWDVTGDMPTEPATACYETATFNTDSCEWDVTGDMPTEPVTACYETATFNTDSCKWDVSGDMPTEPVTACYETATFNTDSCEWDVSGDMPAEPEIACYETATFNTDSCQWDVTGDMPTEPATACYETATFNTDSCEWDVSGDMPTEPETACYETATFNTDSCEWDVSGDMPAEPEIACYETATFNTDSCQWDVTGDMPTEPVTACYETATFNTDSCKWDVSGDMPTEPVTACYETATFNTETCEWDVTGDMPTEPATACYETATFNTDSCEWDVSGDMPTEPETACYETATFNTDSCKWDVSGDMPTEPVTACYETATFNTDSCEWDVSGDMPAEPEIACYETATFNTDSCEWDVSGDMPTEPATACYETATFNTDSCEWDVSGDMPAMPEIACYETATFNSETCMWDVVGTKPLMPNIECYETALWNSITCTWDVSGEPPVIDAGANVLITCQVSPEIILEGEVPYEDVILQWTTNDGHIVGDASIISVVVDESGTYILTATLPNGCVVSDHVIVTIVDYEFPKIISDVSDMDLGCNPSEIIPPVFTVTDGENEIEIEADTEGAICTGGCDYMQTWTASFMDECNNSANELSVTFTWIEDYEDPKIELPVVELKCNENFPEELEAYYSDNCVDSGFVYAGPTNITVVDCVEYADYVFVASDQCNTTEVTLKVQREFDLYDNCETAYGRDPETNSCFIPDFGNWGWTNYFENENEPGEPYVMDLYAGAAQCDITNRTPVGTVTVNYVDGQATVTYDLLDGFVMNEAHVYIGCEEYPKKGKGKKYTVAPGQYNFNPSGTLGYASNYTVGPVNVEGPIYVIAHAVVCEVVCKCSPVVEGDTYEPNNDTLDCTEEELVVEDPRGPKGPKGPKGKNQRTANTFDIYPVPFKTAVNIKYQYAFDTNVTIEVTDIRGVVVASYRDDHYSANMTGEVKFDLSHALDRMLYVRITSNKGSEIKKIISSNAKR
ncbi:BspA family leucine-rich repeat surface protein [Mangrovimonas sp. YM274]|uniref:BspA family leucine-rich repeat surface protein n=1 Tax=Mangrovimonas sp. YM274 TaxID=3070660 RepID=UPI0027DE32CE|nr:BspA family leucine-rich repeat surface protein [Mangrovimonas sp. YM274]WMI67530.1 BspA family leucine-rich repeat surface protein [Mangrovimonas sp. YM274]